MRDLYKLQRNFLILLLLLTLLLAISIGKYTIPISDILMACFNKLGLTQFQYDQTIDVVLFNIRLPRIFLGLLIGGGLSCAGATYQGLFQNPMVSPDLLGASWGAAFGAALGLILSFSYLWVSVMAFGCGLFSVYLTYLVGTRCKSNRKLGFILGGIMIGSLFSAGVSYIKLVADPMNTLPVITYWLMGSLASARMSDVYLVVIPILVGIVPILFMRWRLNLLSLGDDEARSMGIEVHKTRLLLIVCATLITSASVSVSGMIGWIGLVIPHLARMLGGSDNRRVIPLSLILGSIFMLLVDSIARTVTTIEIPLGILTAVIGSPFFLYLIANTKDN